MIVFADKPTIGLMGSSISEMSGTEVAELTNLAERLGSVIAERECVLITGATTGFPEIVSRAARLHGCLTVGISPASSRDEHTTRYSLPDDAVDVIIYTGFGLKGRNVINVRSSDIVIIFGGGIGTLNEFTIAYDEGKIIGVLEGTGGVTTQINGIKTLSRNRAGSELVFDSSPEKLIDACLNLHAAKRKVLKEDA